MKTTTCRNKATGTVYVYEVLESHWDPEKKQCRNKKRLIGKLNEETGEVIPTKSRKRTTEDPDVPDYPSLYKSALKDIQKKDQLIQKLTEDNQKLQDVISNMAAVLQPYLKQNSH